MSSKDSKYYKNPLERTVKAGKKSSQERWEPGLVLQDMGKLQQCKVKGTHNYKKKKR